MSEQLSNNGAPRQRRARSLPEKLGSVVLGFEALVVFLAGLTTFGLRAFPDGWPQWIGIVVGGVFAVAMIYTAGKLQHRWAIIFGWALQALTLVGALVVPAIALLTLVFGGMWAYATLVGARIERQTARRAALGTPSS